MEKKRKLVVGAFLAEKGPLLSDKGKEKEERKERKMNGRRILKMKNDFLWKTYV